MRACGLVVVACALAACSDARSSQPATGSPPHEPAPAVLPTPADARPAPVREAPTTLIAELERHKLDGFTRELFVMHDELYVLVDPAGALYVQDRECPAHGRERLLRLYTSKADVEAYMTSFEPPLLRVVPSSRMTGSQVLALAQQHDVNAMLFNAYGLNYYGDYLSLTTMRPCPLR